MRPPVPRAARVPLGLAAAGGVVAGLAVLAQANLLALLITGPARVWSAVALVGVVGVRALATWAFGAQGRRAAAVVTGTMRRDVLAHVARLGPGWLADRPTGQVTTLVTRGLDAMEPYVRDYLPQLAVAAVLPVAVLVQLIVADPWSALIVAVTLPLVPLFAALAGSRAKASAATQWATLARLGGHFLDAVRGLPTLVLFGRAAAHATAVRRLAVEHQRATVRTLRIAFLSALVLELIAALSVALVAVPIALRLLDGTLDLRTALVVLLVAPEAYLPLRVAGQRFHAATEALAVSADIAELLATPVPDRAPADVSLSGPIGVEMREVTAGYEGPVLRDVSITAEPGEWLAVVGPSGAGKTTLLMMVLGFVRPETGSVLLGGRDVSTVDTPMAWLPQRPHLFNGTVADNIRLGATASDADVRAAGDAVGVGDFVRYDAVLGERGRGLSTGQRQRVALARVILRLRTSAAGVVLLDEPTTGLDLATESAVLDVLRAECAGRTVLVATHRPAVIDAADRVLTIRDGRLVPRDAPSQRAGVAA
jgi:ATP-binding cassette subfamily C protein CydD